MVNLVNSPSWSSSPVWPSSAKQGDVAFLLINSSSSAVRPSPGGWTFYKTLGIYFWPVSAGYRTHIYRHTVGGVPPRMPTTNTSMVVVFGGTRGVGRVRGGVGVAPASAGGGAFIVGLDISGSGNLTMLPSRAQGGGGGTVSSGWATLQGAGVIGNPGWTGQVHAFELLPPRSPSAPLILAPGDGEEITDTGDIDFGWQHQPSQSGGSQDAYRLQNLTTGQYWRASTNTWVSSVTINYSSVEATAIGAGLFPSNSVSEWRVQTREVVDGRWSPWSRASSFMPVTPPSVVVTAPGTTHNNLRPVVRWNKTTPRGAQTAFEVRLIQSNIVIWTSRVQPGSNDNYPIPADVGWINNLVHHVQVRIQQTGGSWSPWTDRGFLFSWTPPAVPDVRAWPAKQGVIVQVSTIPDYEVTLERITPQGLWEPVGVFLSPTAEIDVTDVLAPYKVATAYRAKAALLLDGMPMESDWGISLPVTSTDPHSYVMTATNPLTTWTETFIAEDSSHVHDRSVAVAYGLGDDRPRVSYGRLRGRSGTFTLTTLSQGAARSMLGLLHAGVPLVMRWPAERGDSGLVDAGRLIFDVAGELDTGRLVQVSMERRSFEVPWVEQSAEIGAGTYQDDAPVTDPIERT